MAFDLPVEATFGWIHHGDESKRERQVLEEERVICAFTHKEDAGTIYVYSFSPGREGISAWEFEPHGDEVKHIGHVSKLDLFDLIGTKENLHLEHCNDTWCSLVGTRLPKAKVHSLCNDAIRVCANDPEFTYTEPEKQPTTDDILDKISTHGMDSLSADELQILKHAYESKRPVRFSDFELLEGIRKRI